MQEEFFDCEKSEVPDLVKSTHLGLRVSFLENKNVRYGLHKTPNDSQQMSLDDDVLELSSCLTFTYHLASSPRVGNSKAPSPVGYC